MLYLAIMQRDFDVSEIGEISQLSLKLDLNTFREVCDHLLHLPYRRPSSSVEPQAQNAVSRSIRKTSGVSLAAVLLEGCGTCSSKHGVLKAIAEEQGHAEIELVLCLFQMTSSNTPGIAEVLEGGPLSSIPELHTYIQWGDEKIDVTKPGFHISSMRSVIEKEKTISLSALASKTSIHQVWMKTWLQANRPDVSLEAAWLQREKCIAALSDC